MSENRFKQNVENGNLKKSENIYASLDFFDHNIDSENINNKWLENYEDNPKSFFTEENFHKLAKLDQGERLILLGKASSELSVTPSDVKKYYLYFPEDLHAVAIKFGKDSSSYVKDYLSHNIYGVSINEIIDENPDLGNDYHAEQYKYIAERRELAPDFMIKGYRPGFGRNFHKFGKAADGLGECMREAADLIITGNHFINPDKIFTPEYEQMTEEEKSEFLRKTVAELHYHLLFEEVYNSGFSEKTANMLRTKRANKYFFHGTHSMLYNIHDFPTSIYEQNHSQTMRSAVGRGGNIEEYPYHRLLNRTLEEFKNNNFSQKDKKKNSEFLVDFWDKNRNPIFGAATADALSSQDVNFAAKKLLALIREEKVNLNPLVAVLHRLEFGQIGISEEGVNYLEKIYDLKEYNNPNYHVSRLTANGEIGIFDEEKELIKYFHLGDLSSPEKKIQAKVMDFTYDTLFIGREEETEEEKQKRLGYLKEFKQNYYDIANDEIFSKTGVRLNNMSFKEQGWFVINYNEANDKKKERLKNFTKIYKEQGIKTFLSLEAGEDAGDDILSLAENFDSQAASAIFAKFNEMTDVIKETEKDLSKKFFKSDKVVKPSAEILKRGRMLLAKFANKANNWQKEGENTKEKTIEILSELNKIKSEAIFFAAMFKTAYKQGEKLEFDEIKNTDYEHVVANEISKEDIKEMKVIYEENYTAYPKEFREVLLNAFDKSLKNNNSYYDILRYQGKVVAFLRFDYQGKTEDGLDKKHFAAFNVDANYGNGKLGEAMLKKALERESKNSVIIAECDAQAPITKKYFELGFKKTGEFDFKGIKSLNIELRKE